MDRVNELLGIFGISDGKGKAIAHLKNDMHKVVDRENISEYYMTRVMVFDFIDDDDKRYQFPKKKGKALYYYKRAMQFGDLKAAHKYLNKYYLLGGYKKPDISIDLAHPLSSLHPSKRKVFRQSLNKHDDDMIRNLINNMKGNA